MFSIECFFSPLHIFLSHSISFSALSRPTPFRLDKCCVTMILIITYYVFYSLTHHLIYKMSDDNFTISSFSCMTLFIFPLSVMLYQLTPLLLHCANCFTLPPCLFMSFFFFVCACHLSFTSSPLSLHLDCCHSHAISCGGASCIFFLTQCEDLLACTVETVSPPLHFLFHTITLTVDSL